MIKRRQVHGKRASVISGFRHAPDGAVAIQKPSAMAPRKLATSRLIAAKCLFAPRGSLTVGIIQRPFRRTADCDHKIEIGCYRIAIEDLSVDQGRIGPMDDVEDCQIGDTRCRG